ncbi:sigma-70 family RNA polymerase sigma factor [Microbacterium sp. NPDC089189]|uniref:RNA polymerase sigma factor n=1 Tax=Microbacterium sp. NPDC089189 TaxID=3154972 RepID=UPI00343AF95C
MSAADDSDLVEQLRDGNKHAFDELMRKHGSTVFRYAWALADSPEQVEDLVQDTFLTLWRRRRRITLVGGSLLPWLLTTCRFTAFNSNRRLRRSSTIPIESVEHSLTLHDDPAEQDTLRWIRDEVARLPDSDRKLLNSCLVEGRPYEEVASELGISASTARKRIQRVRARLRAAHLKEES